MSIKNAVRFVAIFSLFFAGALWGESYTTKVKQLYLPNAQKAVGRLLPSAEVKMIGEKDGKAEVEISGWIEDGVPSAVYFAPNRRILVAGINKTTQYSFDSGKSVEDGGKKWILIKAKFLTEKDGCIKARRKCIKQTARFATNSTKKKSSTQISGLV